MELTKDIYLNCGIYKSLLFIVSPGFFASDAWTQSDEAYNNISGTKFSAVTSDDCYDYMLPREEIRRLSEDDDLDMLLNNACDDFKKLFNELFLEDNK